jgi:small conductance mechanosensitive channel
MLGVMGVVNRIEIFSTTLTTGGNKTIVVLNGEVSYSTIMNFSAQDTRWIDIVFGIGYDDDLKRAKQLLKGRLKRMNVSLKIPNP